ncbi:MAG TPA: lycopene cyclase [Candidatus Poseidoniaceae archaeon]|nr:MAG TPA: lycopene cyclase [Candidatus Poseidoniales archaeon]HII38074.1 lycopene cyclase [Candidatus Poseidoniaceae archaeon]
MSPDIEIIGDGCAALSLAARASELTQSITLIKPSGAPPTKDHVWGFWSDPLLVPAQKLARATWQKWAIITHTDRAVLGSETRPYNAFKRSDWTKHCKELAESAKVAMIEETKWRKSADSLVFDTRPPIVPDGCMLQHFHGIEITTEQPCFDPDMAILMDFRVDQSRGMHFIYLLPYSTTEALVESTLFSTELVDEEFYSNSIEDYLKKHCKVKQFSITHQEKGVIPLGKLAPHDAKIPGLGSNAGATRPASGYAFLFIQKQVDTAIKLANSGKQISFKNPHKRIDLWMDSVFLTVLKYWPEHGPNMFLRMGKALSGDQFVKFMSGDAGWLIRLKVIFAMPKWPFVKALTKHILPTRKTTTAAVA